MIASIILFAIVPGLVVCSSDGNIHLLKDEVALALKSCNLPFNESTDKDYNYGHRHRRSNEDTVSDSRIDTAMGTEINGYDHERRNTSDLRNQIHVLNATDYDYAGFGAASDGEKIIHTIPKQAVNDTQDINKIRNRRSEQLMSKTKSDQCLSQCVFANLQVVDSRGIPREAELWNKVQSAVTSQQSRAALHDQIRACFQDLQTEAEDNGCSYSNKLERCLMLRFSDRKAADNKKDNRT